jgi:hypothetical protein
VKKLICLTVLTVTAILTAGCGSAEPQPEPVKTSSPQTPPNAGVKPAAW